MNNRKISIVIGLLSTVLVIVSILVMFATAFGASDNMGNPSSHGNCFNVAFGYQNYDAIPLLIVAFVFQCVAAFFALVGSFIPGRIGGIALGFAGLLAIVGGVVWFFSPNLFIGTNGNIPEAETVVNGVGSILTGIFAAVGGLIGLYGAYRTFKA